MPSSDLLIPLLIVVGSILIGLAVHFLKRPSPSREDIVAPDPNGGRGRRKSASLQAEDAVLPVEEVSRAALVNWHGENEEVVLDYLESHEDLIDQLSTDTMEFPKPVLGEQLDSAIASHPSSGMAAQLSALQVAAAATLRSLRRSQPETAAEHHQTYARYRIEWMDRLWQFPKDRERVREVRNSSVPELPDSPQLLTDTEVEPDSGEPLLWFVDEQDASEGTAADDEDATIVLTDDPDPDDPDLEDDDDGPLPPVNPLEPDEEPTGKHAAINLEMLDEFLDEEPAGRHAAAAEPTGGRLSRLFRR